MKIERIYDAEASITLEGIINSLVQGEIDKVLNNLYSTNINHTTSSEKGDVI